MIIGIAGLGESGKDTFANRVIERYGFNRVSLADPMKDFCKEIFDFSEEQVRGPSQSRNAVDYRYPRQGRGFLTPREALQLLGTEWGRHCYPDVWVNYALRNAKAKIANGAAGVVIPDVRFANEIHAIRQVGLVVRIDRASVRVPWWERVFGRSWRSHVSERELLSLPSSSFDYVLTVPEGLDAYHARIDAVMDDLVYRQRMIRESAALYAESTDNPEATP